MTAASDRFFYHYYFLLVPLHDFGEWNDEYDAGQLIVQLVPNGEAIETGIQSTSRGRGGERGAAFLAIVAAAAGQSTFL